MKKDTAKQKPTPQRIAGLITVGVFVVLIFVVSIYNALVPQKSFSESENRYLQKFPEFSWAALVDGTFISKFEEFTSDQFILRDEFIGIKTAAEFAVGKKDTNNVFFAKDGYLIQKHDEPDAAQLENNIKFVTEFANGMTDKMESVAVMIIPTASEILVDKLPLWGEGTDFDQRAVIDEVKSKLNDKVVFPDLLSTMSDHKDEYIYYKTDHHWTTLGAYYGYRNWAEGVGIAGHTLDDYSLTTVTDQFYGTVYSKARLINTKPDSIVRLNPNFDAKYSLDYNKGMRTTDTLYADEWLQKRDKYSYFLGGNDALIKITSENKNGRKLAIIKDSYAHSFAPIVVDDFEETHLIDLRYMNLSLKGYLEEQGITDVLVLYNTINFSTDNKIFLMTK